jgi:hypothetical protein
LPQVRPLRLAAAKNRFGRVVRLSDPDSRGASRCRRSEEPDLYNALYVTNFVPHHHGDDLARGGEWVAVRPLHPRHPLKFDLTGMLDYAMQNYHRVPEITEEGEILD